MVCEDVAAAKRSSASSLFAPRALFKLGVDRSSKLMVAGVAEELNEDEDERSFLVTNDPAGGEGKLAKCLQLGGKRLGYNSYTSTVYCELLLFLSRAQG